MSSMLPVWKKELPKKEGWYFYKSKKRVPNKKAHVVKAILYDVDGKLYMGGVGGLQGFPAGLYAGPIPEPSMEDEE